MSTDKNNFIILFKKHRLNCYSKCHIISKYQTQNQLFLWDIQVKVSTKMSKYTLYQIWSKKSWWSSFKVQFAQKTKTCWKIKKNNTNTKLSSRPISILNFYSYQNDNLSITVWPEHHSKGFSGKAGVESMSNSEKV